MRCGDDAAAFVADAAPDEINTAALRRNDFATVGDAAGTRVPAEIEPVGEEISVGGGSSLMSCGRRQLRENASTSG